MSEQMGGIGALPWHFKKWNLLPLAALLLPCIGTMGCPKEKPKTKLIYLALCCGPTCKFCQWNRRCFCL
jgi:hypothetical protein